MTDTPIERIALDLPRRFPGPGGAAAVLRDGEVILRHAWGFANAERRIPFTPRTLFRLCSITKQFACATMLDRLTDPTVLDDALRASLPMLDGAMPRTLHLAHNQSGLRDYWAVAMLHGSPVEAPFGAEESARVIAGTRSLHFTPGTRYSYVNQNFRLISEMLEAHTGRSFADLLRTGVFDRAGMETALLAADTRAMPDGTEGYEGTQASGFRAAVNRIHWTGDAGLGASLDDMIAWEQHVDATRDDAASLYRRLSAPVAFADGAPAFYGFGLARSTEFGRAATGHGGALRGWRSNRIHLASERLSVVVMFNHLSDAHAAMLDLLAAALGEERTSRLSTCRHRPGAAPMSILKPACPRGSTRPRPAASGCDSAMARNCSTCGPMGRPTIRRRAWRRRRTGCAWCARRKTRRRCCARPMACRASMAPGDMSAPNSARP